MLRAIYYNDADEAETQVWSLRFASSIIGPLGTTVESQIDEDDQDTKSGAEGSGMDEVISSKDPFSAGMAVSETSSAEMTLPGAPLSPTSVESRSSGSGSTWK
ncbi:hypothetical protein C0991_007135 [Blastosporella zonata]|nr:hypothetical protein C0991_007135 [Blastosporella zonata]